MINPRHLLGLGLALALQTCTLTPVPAADMAAPNLSEWYNSLAVPDRVAGSMATCCGEADAYWADETEIGPNGELIAIITDTQDNKRKLPNGLFVNRQPVPIGTRITVPPSKIRRNPETPNPTGHTIIFLASDLSVYCYEPQHLM